MRRIVGGLVLTALLVAVATGCGGGGGGGGTTSGSAPLSKIAYEQQMQTIEKNLSNTVDGLVSATSSPAAAAKALTKVQQVLRSGAKQIAAMNPPADIASDQKQLASAANEFADEIGPVIAKVKGGNLAAIDSLLTLKGYKDLDAAINAITAKAYKLKAPTAG